jgi:hypothetical protein
MPLPMLYKRLVNAGQLSSEYSTSDDIESQLIYSWIVLPWWKALCSKLALHH